MAHGLAVLALDRVYDIVYDYIMGKELTMRTQLLYYPAQYHQQVRAEIDRQGYKRWHVYASQIFHSNYGFVIVPVKMAETMRTFIQGVEDGKNIAGPRPEIL